MTAGFLEAGVSMVRTFLVALLGATLFLSPLVASAKHATTPPLSLVLYTTQSEAVRGCHGDEVVWLNTRTSVYHEKGMRWYGRTKEGAYVCRSAADAAGDRDTRNGQ
jgi:hypothetical protein